MPADAMPNCLPFSRSGIVPLYWPAALRSATAAVTRGSAITPFLPSALTSSITESSVEDAASTSAFQAKTSLNRLSHLPEVASFSASTPYLKFGSTGLLAEVGPSSCARKSPKPPKDARNLPRND